MTKRLIKRGETSGRIDDNEETITKRLQTFHEETTPISGYYGKQGKLVTIDANRHEEDVFGDVDEVLKRVLDHKKVGKQLELNLSICFSIKFSQKELTQENNSKGIRCLLLFFHCIHLFV